MVKPVQADLSHHVRKETALLIALLALAAGFFGGVFFGVYKSGPGVAGAPTAPKEVPAQAAALEKETRQNPSNVAAWIELGNLYFDADQYEKAISAYRKALELKPDNADVLTDLGVMYRKAGRSEEAVKAFDQATAVNPKHEVSRLNKGIVLLHDLHDPAGAVRAWEGLLEINPVATFPGGMTVDQMIQQLKKQGLPPPAEKK